MRMNRASSRWDAQDSGDSMSENYELIQQVGVDLAVRPREQREGLGKRLRTKRQRSLRFWLERLQQPVKSR